MKCNDGLMNFTIQSYGEEAPRWWVVEKDGDSIARCYTQENAAKVAAALNRMEADRHRGEDRVFRNLDRT